MQAKAKAKKTTNKKQKEGAEKKKNSYEIISNI